MTITTRLRRFAALGAAIAAFALAGCSTSPSSTPASAAAGASGSPSATTTQIRLGYFNGSALGAQTALDQGYYAAAGLDVTLVPLQAGPQIIQSTAQGQVDIGYGDVYAYANAVLNGFTTVSLVTPANVTSGWLFEKKGETIAGAKDLEGKTVGVTPTPYPAALVKDWVKANGGDPAKVKFSTVPIGSQVSALQSGSVDAVFSFDFLTNARLKAAGGTQIADVGGEYTSSRATGAAYYANDAFATAHPDAVKAFVDATRKGAVYFSTASQTEQISLYDKVYNVDLKSLDAQLPGLLDSAKSEGFLPTSADDSYLLSGPIDVDATQKYLDTGIEYGAVTKDFTLADHLADTAKQ